MYQVSYVKMPKFIFKYFYFLFWAWLILTP